MNTAVFRTSLHRDAPRRIARLAIDPRLLRVLLVVVCAASVAVGLQVGDPAAALLADRELAHLLRGMAILKGLMVVAAIVILWWRFGQPIAPRIATAYVASTGLMAASAATIWQLTALLPAAAAFHAGLFIALVVAWRADGGRTVRATPLD